jgi:hypothetical protein
VLVTVRPCRRAVDVGDLARRCCVEPRRQQRLDQHRSRRRRHHDGPLHLGADHPGAVVAVVVAVTSHGRPDAHR